MVQEDIKMIKIGINFSLSLFYKKSKCLWKI